MSKQLKTVPRFANEAEERTFWETHDSTDYLDWTQAQRVVLPNLKPTPKPYPCACPSTFWTRSRPPPIPAMYLTSR